MDQVGCDSRDRGRRGRLVHDGFPKDAGRGLYHVQATLGSIETYYNFDGLVKAKRVQTITAAQSDKVRTVYVTQNQQVKKASACIGWRAAKPLRPISRVK